MVFETTGGVNDEGLELLRQLFRFAAKHQNLQLSVYCGRAWARLSCSLQSSVSQCFLNRAGSEAAIERDIDFVDLIFDWGRDGWGREGLFSCHPELLFVVCDVSPPDV